MSSQNPLTTITRHNLYSRKLNSRPNDQTTQPPSRQPPATPITPTFTHRPHGAVCAPSRKPLRTAQPRPPIQPHRSAVQSHARKAHTHTAPKKSPDPTLARTARRAGGRGIQEPVRGMGEDAGKAGDGSPLLGGNNLFRKRRGVLRRAGATEAGAPGSQHRICLGDPSPHRGWRFG